MPRFSVVLPSTDRPALLPAAIKSALSSKFDDYEIIVSDNYSRQPVTEVAEPFKDRRIRHLRTNQRLPVSDHWEFIWGQVKGEFVMFLGDDNALHPDALTIADAAIRKHDLELAAWRALTYYHSDWNVEYPPLPNRGNIVGLDPGSTNHWYRCDPAAVLRQFAQSLRLSACFPCMLNGVFRRDRGEQIRRHIGRLFLAPNPDIVASVLILGTIPNNAYAFYDGHLAIGGRSSDSNFASLLSRGTKSRRIYDYIAELAGQEVLPHHKPTFVAITNTLTAALSQARYYYPKEFSDFAWSRKTLALRTFDDIYNDRTTPWADDPKFLAEVNAFVETLPPAEREEVIAYRDNSIKRLKDSESPSLKKRISQIRTALNRWTWTNKSSAWVAGGATYIDMAQYGVSDISGVVQCLIPLLGHYNSSSATFADYHKNIGMLGEELQVGWGQ